MEVSSNLQTMSMVTSYTLTVLPMVYSIRLSTLTCLQIDVGSGSGQQSVTGFPHASDANSLWIVEAASGRVCRRG